MSEAPVAVTFVSSSAELGGAELYLVSLLDSLGEEWIDAVVVPEDGELVELLRERGLPLEVVPFGRRIGLAAGALRLRSLLRRRGARVVHANGSRAAMVAALAGPPVVWLRVDHTLDGRAAGWLARRCERTVALSDSVLRAIPPGAWQGEVIYPGIASYDLGREEARAMVLAALDCPADAEVIVLSGRLGPGKGQRELLEAAPKVFDQRAGARIALLGGARHAYPQHEAELRDLARGLGVDARVHFLGHRGEHVRSQRDAVRFVAGCDVLAAPSVREPPYGWQEGFGLAVAEALAVGTPVVASRNGSLPEVVGDCGGVVAEGDVAALADALIEVLDDAQLRARMAACGRRRAAEAFSGERSLAAMRRVYRRAAAGDRRRSR